MANRKSIPYRVSWHHYHDMLTAHDPPTPYDDERPELSTDELRTLTSGACRRTADDMKRLAFTVENWPTPGAATFPELAAMEKAAGALHLAVKLAEDVLNADPGRTS